MSEVSKAVADRLAITRTLTSSIEVHGKEVVSQLEAILFPHGAPPNCNLQILWTALGSCVQRAVDDTATKDQAHATELADDAPVRETRDASRADLRAYFASVRGTFENLYGAAIASVYGLAGETPTDAEALIQAATTTEGLLRNRPITATPIHPGVVIDPKAIADGLKQRSDVLRGALGDVRREEREAQVTRGDRNASMDTWNQRYQGIADITTGFFELAGRHDLADRVRPTARRRAGLTEKIDEDTPATGEPTKEPAKPENG